MSRDLDQMLDPGFRLDRRRPETIKGWLKLLSQPVGGPADKVGGQGGKIFLQSQSWLSPDFQVMHLEDPFAFFDPGFNRLAAIVSLKPGG